VHLRALWRPQLTERPTTIAEVGFGVAFDRVHGGRWWAGRHLRLALLRRPPVAAQL